MSHKLIKAFKPKHAKRAAIPSHEEAGAEAAPVTDYDDANFIVRQAFFCGAEKDEFDDWKKGLTNLAALGAKKKAEKTLKIEIDEEAFARLYGHQSHPFPVKEGQQIAVRVISQFGEETTKVVSV